MCGVKLSRVPIPLVAFIPRKDASLCSYNASRKVAQILKQRTEGGASAPPSEIYPNDRARYGPMLDAEHADAVDGAGGVGGVAHGTALKSKNSSRFGCAASRFVRCAEELMNRLSTNLITAVWSIGVCET